MGKGSFSSDTPQNFEINIEASVISEALITNPAFIEAVAKEIRTQMTKDVRWMGNLFSKWASTNPPAPTTRNRISN